MGARITIAALAGAAFMFATPANADDQSFLDELNAWGVPTGPQTVELGHEICDELSGGSSLDDTRFHIFDPSRDPRGPASYDAVKTTIAAQRNICPDPRPWIGVHPW